MFDIKSYLSKFVPCTPHEGIPHGVPEWYRWRNNSTNCQDGTNQNCAGVDTGCLLTEDYKLGNWWGQIYVDDSNYHAPNTRVNVWKDVTVLFLYQGDSQWQVVQHSIDPSKWGGAGYPEDFYGSNIPINKRIEPDGSISYVPTNGYLSHFYPGPWFTASKITWVHVIVIAYTRLILANPNGQDDRSSSRYLIGVGADNRRESSPTTGIKDFGLGKMIRPTNQWTTLVHTNIPASKLNTLPMPSEEYFKSICAIPEVRLEFFR